MNFYRNSLAAGIKFIIYFKENKIECIIIMYMLCFSTIQLLYNNISFI